MMHEYVWNLLLIHTRTKCFIVTGVSWTCNLCDVVVFEGAFKHFCLYIRQCSISSNFRSLLIATNSLLFFKPSFSSFDRSYTCHHLEFLDNIYERHFII